MTHHDPDGTEPGADPRLAGLLSGMADADFERVDPPAGLLDAIQGRLSADTTDEARPAPDLPPTVLPDRRTRRPKAWLAAAAAAILIAGVVGVIVANRADPEDRILASARLEQLEPLGSTTATARLVEEADGRTHLVLDATGMAAPPAGSSYELWLIDREVSDPRSLGTVTGSSDVVVPTSIDPSEYVIVDISLEPDDGDQAHSGHSLMRGTLS